MKFPWHKYEELPLNRRNTLQVYITNKCNLKCKGCFARNIIKENNTHISLLEYRHAIKDKKIDQVNLLGGEPLLHPQLKTILNYNRDIGLKTTIYTNGWYINKYKIEDFKDIKLRVSITSSVKLYFNIPKTNIPFDANFMVGRKTTINDLILSATYVEKKFNSRVFFISSFRELDNPRHEFFDDTDLTMPVIQYKELVHDFLNRYNGNMDIHISKRGVFESTVTLPDNKCRFSNYFIGGKVIQCPYDVVNMKFQDNYSFNNRYCQQNNTCLMSKVIYRKKR